MKKLWETCLECGSRELSRTVDDVMPKFKMEVISYACGAELKSIYSSNGNIGRVCLSDCSTTEEQVSPI
jgi:hypothetical protein